VGQGTFHLEQHASICDGYTLTPRMISMSSLRRPMRRMRRRERPQAQAPGTAQLCRACGSGYGMATWTGW